MFRRQDLEKFIRTALECSVYVQPRTPGLTYSELLEIGRQLDFGDGELADMIRDLRNAKEIQQTWGDSLIRPCGQVTWTMFTIVDDPEYRNPKAFKFVLTALGEVVRQVGRAGAQLARDVVVERGRLAGFSPIDVEVAITMLSYAEILREKDGVLSFVPGKEGYGDPMRRDDEPDPPRSRRNESRAQVYALVKDKIERRSDGRPQHCEPLDAFAEKLVELGYGPFRMWWKQMVNEFRRLEPAVSPVAVTVMSAALVEGALTFTVKYARGLGIGLFKSSDYDKPERTWKIDDLIKSASTGNVDAVLDAAAQGRANQLSLTRQRIHAGRMLSDSPGGVPDLRPEEARDAKHTAEMIVRRVIEWIDDHARPR